MDGPRPWRILVTGAAGSGTSTLARAIGEHVGGRVIESDDLYWLPSDPPYAERRDPGTRLALALAARDADPTTPSVTAGSVMDWGQALEDGFDLIVFLHVPTAARLERLRARELARFGRVDEDFLAWAASYDAGTAEGRNLGRHMNWLDAREAPVLTLVGRQDTAQQLAKVLAALRPPGAASA